MEIGRYLSMSSDLSTVFELTQLVLPYGNIQLKDLISLSLSSPLLKYVACQKRINHRIVELLQLSVDKHFLIEVSNDEVNPYCSIKKLRYYWAIVDQIDEFEMSFSIVYHCSKGTLDYNVLKPTNHRVPGSQGKIYIHDEFFEPVVIMPGQYEQIRFVAIDSEKIQITSYKLLSDECGFPCFTL